MFRVICTHLKCRGKEKSFGISTFMEHLAHHTSEDNNSNSDMFAFRCSLSACDACFVTKLHAEEHAHQTGHLVLSTTTDINGRSTGGIEFAKVLKINGSVEFPPTGQNHVVNHQERDADEQRLGHKPWRGPPTTGIERRPGSQPGAEFGYPIWNERDGQYAHKFRNFHGSTEVPRSRTPGFPILRLQGPRETDHEIYEEHSGSRVSLQTRGIEQEEEPHGLDRTSESGCDMDIDSPTFEYPPERKRPEAEDVPSQDTPIPRLRTKSETFISYASPPKRARRSSESQGNSGVGASSTAPFIPGKLALIGESFKPVPPPDQSILRMMKKKQREASKTDNRHIIPLFSLEAPEDVPAEAVKKPSKTAKVQKPSYQFDPGDFVKKRPNSSAARNNDDLLILDDLPLAPLPTFEEIFEQDGRDSEDEIILLGHDNIPKVKESELAPAPLKTPLRAFSPPPETPHRSFTARPLRPITRGSPVYDVETSRPRASQERSRQTSRSRGRSNSRDREHPMRDRRTSESSRDARKKAVEDWDVEVTRVSYEHRSTFSRYSGQRPPRNLVKIGILPEVPHRKPTPPRGSWEAKQNSKLRTQERKKEYEKKRANEKKRSVIGKVKESEDDEVNPSNERNSNDSDTGPMTRTRSRKIQRLNYTESPIKKTIAKKSSKNAERSPRSYSHSPRSASP